jgi:hypothetical protein
VGLLDPVSLPVGGIEQARKLLGVAERDTDQLEVSASGL